MKIEERPIHEIHLYDKNAKKHPDKQVFAIANSIKEFGFNQPIVVDKQGVIIVGHGRYLAAVFLELEKVPTLTVDLTEEQAKAYRLADNKLNESEWDMELVIQELKELSMPMLDLTGFDRDIVIMPDEKDDQVPDVPEKPKSKLGDIYQIGMHRVMCGDSTKVEDVDKLMDGKKADMVFTSPPYNIGKGKMYETYEDNLTSNEYEKFLQDVIKICNFVTRGIIFWNMNYNQNNKKTYLRTLASLGENTGLNFRELITWDKDWAMPISQSDSLTRQTEQILVLEDENKETEIDYFVVFDNIKRPFLKRTQRKLSNYWKTKSGKRNLENHKACYPVELVVKAILISTKEKEVVYEPFCGSGTNIIGAEKTGRICYGMELDPKYIDVIIQRYVDYTGNNKIIKNGKEIEWI